MSKEKGVAKSATKAEIVSHFSNLSDETKKASAKAAELILADLNNE